MLMEMYLRSCVSLRTRKKGKDFPMTRLLHIAASPRGKTSESLRLAEAFLETYRSAHPDVTVDTLDLWAEPLIAFDGTKAGAKMTVIGGGTPVGAESDAWAAIVATFK